MVLRRPIRQILWQHSFHPEQLIERRPDIGDFPEIGDEEPTDEELENVDPLYFGRRYLDSSTKRLIWCDNLENIIKND